MSTKVTVDAASAAGAFTEEIKDAEIGQNPPKQDSQSTLSSLSSKASPRPRLGRNVGEENPSPRIFKFRGEHDKDKSSTSRPVFRRNLTTRPDIDGKK